MADVERTLAEGMVPQPASTRTDWAKVAELRRQTEAAIEKAKEGARIINRALNKLS